jgi:hypothetical protein
MLDELLHSMRIKRRTIFGIAHFVLRALVVLYPIKWRLKNSMALGHAKAAAWGR